MLVGQQLGPYLIEKEIGAGAMGAVYRGKNVKNGRTVAVKIMAPGLGTSSDSAGRRFEREADILKQLNHPNIVKLFGVGKFQGTAYYAMEYVQGESLDHVMARRDRMTWEEVVDLGQQLCSALQHAHEKGIVHRDLKPSNLMILRDGTLKLTDFGIAKDLDVTQLTGANCTIGTASYMSPEQCRGDPDINFKSDLYSLGIVFYELITGRKPFVAENAMEVFMMHVSGPFVRPSRIVLDLPVWMDTLICQLMEKKPDARPLDAAMVSQVLGSIQEKVEAQQSAGVLAAQARRLDRPRGERKAGDEDRDAARSLLGKRKTKRKKKRAGRLPVWVQALGLLLVLGCIIAALVFALSAALAGESLPGGREDDGLGEPRSARPGAGRTDQGIPAAVRQPGERPDGPDSQVGGRLRHGLSGASDRQACPPCEGKQGPRGGDPRRPTGCLRGGGGRVRRRRQQSARAVVAGKRKRLVRRHRPGETASGTAG